jgi:Mor family transcriptional regulator
MSDTQLDLGTAWPASSAATADAMPPADAWPSMLAELVDVLVASFRARGRDEQAAIADAQAAALAIGEYMGGRQLYLPRGDRLREWLRDRRIYLEYKGINKGELARRYRLTERRIEQIYAQQHAVHVRRVQPRLFEG